MTQVRNARGLFLIQIPLLTTVDIISDNVELTFHSINGGMAKAVLFFTGKIFAIISPQKRE